MTFRDRASALMAMIWVAAILGGYYVETAGYYREKLAVFGRFLLGGG